MKTRNYNKKNMSMWKSKWNQRQTCNECHANCNINLGSCV